MSLKIKKLKLSNSWPQLIIIEGFWRIGKSTFIKELLEKEQFNLINEPNHLIEAPNIKNSHQWYFEKHFERQNLAHKLMKDRKKVIMERSILSNIAFDYANQCKITKKSEKIIKNLSEFKQFSIIFLYAKKQFIENAIERLEDDFVKNTILKNKNFYSNYMNFYKNILSGIIGSNLFCIDVAPNGKFLNFRELIKNLEIKITREV